MYFSKAKLIFPKGKRHDIHCFAGFYAELDYNCQNDVFMQITAMSFYKLYVNGEFVFYGPARAAHEHARVDTPDIKPYLKNGKNSIAVEVIGYCGYRSLAGTGEPSYLIAQVDIDNEPVLFTGDGSWKCFILPYKDAPIEPLSHARFWREDFTVCPESHCWRTGTHFPEEREIEIINTPITFLPRVADHPDFTVVRLNSAGYTSGIKKATMTDVIAVHEAKSESYIDFDFGCFRSGFIGIEFECDEPCTVTLMYQDKISREKGEFSLIRSGQNAYTRAFSFIKMSPGVNKIETFEAYVARYMRIIVTGCTRYTIKNLYVRLCQIKDLNGGGFVCSDGEINRIYRANRTSLILNTFDAFMDCAMRERGSGWNDASYWTALASQMMLGDRSVEKCYLENQIKDSVKKYCDIPYACYPGMFRCIIHDWTIYLLEHLYDYYKRSDDKELLTSHKTGIEWLVDSLNKYKNKYGLLENLDQIVYTSSATVSEGFTGLLAPYNQPIATVTNITFAKAIRQLGSVLDHDDWIAQADAIDAIMQKVVAQIDDHEESGGFCPSSIYMNENGEPVSTGYECEGAQYFWIKSGLFNNKNLPMKLGRIFDHMGPDPKVKYNADLYSIKRMGYEGDLFVRMEALSKCGRVEQMVNEIKTLGLWQIDNFNGLMGEGWDWFANNHHNFVAFLNYMLQKDILGTDYANELDKTITLVPHTLDLNWAKGHMTTNNGILSVHWINDDKRFTFKADIPEGYTVYFTVPESVCSRNRQYFLNGEPCDVPANGVLKIENDFEFESCYC